MKNNNKETVNRAQRALKSNALEARLEHSESSIKLMRDYISVLQLNYSNKLDSDSMNNLVGLLFHDNALDHFDELLESVSKTIDDVLVTIILAKENNNK